MSEVVWICSCRYVLGPIKPFLRESGGLLHSLIIVTLLSNLCSLIIDDLASH